MSVLAALFALVLLATATRQLPAALALAAATLVGGQVEMRAARAADAVRKASPAGGLWDAPSPDQIRALNASFSLAMRQMELHTLFPALGPMQAAEG